MVKTITGEWPGVVEEVLYKPLRYIVSYNDGTDVLKMKTFGTFPAEKVRENEMA